MSNPLVLKDIIDDDYVCLEVIKNVHDCFVYEEHKDMALKNITILKKRNNTEDKNNIFGIYKQNTIIGVTGLWYDNNCLLKDFAFLRWTGIIDKYRGLRLFPYVIELLVKEAIKMKKLFLIEIAHTKNAKEAFESNGFDLIPNNEKHLDFILNLLGEDKGSYILVKSIYGDIINWNVLHECYDKKIEYYIPEEQKHLHRGLTRLGWSIIIDAKTITEDMAICIVDATIVIDMYFYSNDVGKRNNRLMTAISNGSAYYQKCKLTGQKYEKEYRIESLQQYIRFNLGIVIEIGDDKE